MIVKILDRFGMNRFLLFAFVILLLPACQMLKSNSNTVKADKEKSAIASSEQLPTIPTEKTVSKNDSNNHLDESNNNVVDDSSDLKDKKDSPYTLNVGDVLEVSVLDEPEMTREVTVIPDGSITYLLVGEVKAEGLTIAELRKSLTKKLSEFFVTPYVSIITKSINVPTEDEKRISILGALKNPGNYTWHKGDRILDVIAEAGGLLYTQTELGSRATANLKASYLSRKGKDVDVDFYKLIRLGNMKYNLKIEPEDFIYIADAEETNIVVMGEVGRPRVIPFTREMSVVEALSIAGGFTQLAYQSRVVILRTAGTETKYVEVDINDLLHGNDVKNLMLKGGDIVYVPEQTLSEYARWAGFLSDIAELVLQGYRVREAIRFPKLDR